LVALQTVFEVLEVFGIEGCGQELFDDRKKVVHGSDERQWREFRVACASSGRCECEGGGDNLLGDAALVELDGQAPVFAAEVSESSGSPAVTFEDLLNVRLPSWTCW